MVPANVAEFALNSWSHADIIFKETPSACDWHLKQCEVDLTSLSAAWQSFACGSTGMTVISLDTKPQRQLCFCRCQLPSCLKHLSDGSVRQQGHPSKSLPAGASFKESASRVLTFCECVMRLAKLLLQASCAVPTVWRRGASRWWSSTRRTSWTWTTLCWPGCWTLMLSPLSSG